MLIEYQQEMVPIYEESGKAFIRRQLTGDQKTEINTTSAILSKTDELTSGDRLLFLLPAHEYFH